jgi:hypothetical protein
MEKVDLRGFWRELLVYLCEFFQPENIKSGLIIVIFSSAGCFHDNRQHVRWCCGRTMFAARDENV